MAVHRGIDIAGDKGNTGVVDLIDTLGSLEVAIRPRKLTSGEALFQVADDELASCAVDQPLR